MELGIAEITYKHFLPGIAYLSKKASYYMYLILEYDTYIMNIKTYYFIKSSKPVSIK